MCEVVVNLLRIKGLCLVGNLKICELCFGHFFRFLLVEKYQGLLLLVPVCNDKKLLIEDNLLSFNLIR